MRPLRFNDSKLNRKVFFIKAKVTLETYLGGSRYGGRYAHYVRYLNIKRGLFSTFHVHFLFITSTVNYAFAFRKGIFISINLKKNKQNGKNDKS